MSDETDLSAYEGESADIRRLVEDNAQISELQRQPGWQVLTRYVNEWLDAHENRLRSGAIDDLQEYKLVAGRCDGIRQILNLPDHLQRALETARKNVEQPSGWEDPGFIDSFAVETLSAPEYAPVTDE